MSGLLLALDGPSNKDGPVVVATTNRYEKLDNALKRPGRFNHHIKLDWSNDEQQRNLFKKYFNDATPDDQDILVENLKGKQISCASLVGMLRSGHLGEFPKSPREIAFEAQNIKSARDVGGDRIDLDSPLVPFLQELEVDNIIIERFIEEGLETVRDFKVYNGSNNIYDFFMRPNFELEIFEKVTLTNAHKTLVDKITDQETKDKERKDKKKEKLKKKLKKEKKKLKKLEKEKNKPPVEEKKPEDVEKKPEDGEKPAEKPKEESVDDDTDESIDEYMESLRERIDINLPLEPYLIEHNVPEKIRTLILKNGFATLEHFKLVELSELISKIQGKKIENLSLQGYAKISHAIKIANERITESDEFIDVK